ncbi:hypothetical protein [Roseateles toxinivorans]|uniref:Uncharacterized protein n=1 Tax=Roseateles toxinivorans TaxID=270368 RepID=A0A4R6QMG9_9BURK|nr:hypothetical protein [Roseateles toxinivorans]TDP71062.1 hypothetical protein DES47_10340 [Roseateles toxinivorans]
MYINNPLGKRVYELSKELADNPARIAKTQALTLNADKPLLGLLGDHGLFGSREWWLSIKEGRIEVRVYKGTIQRLYVAGQDAEEDDGKDFEYLCDDGSVRRESCVANDHVDLGLYREGATVALAYALDKLKKQPARDGGTNFTEVLLEVAVS